VKIPHFTPCKAVKMTLADMQEIWWESPDDWDFENKTLTEKCKKLKCNTFISKSSKQASTKNPRFDLSGEAVVAIVSGAKCSKAIISPMTPSSSTHRSARGKGQDAESMF
jgi:hypothetical protein